MTEQQLHQLFSGFTGREEALRKILRYYTRQRVMFYRTNDWIHAKKVSWLVDDLAPLARKTFGEKFNPDFAKMLALVHDDLEIVIGDIQAGDKFRMTAEQKSTLKQKEWEAVQKLIEKFPQTVGLYQYRELMESAWKLDTTEAQLVKLADKFDACGEALHEIFAGNDIFLEHITSPYGVNPTPVEYYSEYFKHYSQNLPLLKPLLNIDHPVFQKLPTDDLKTICQSGCPHTQKSINKNTGYAPYDYWKQIILKNASPEEIADLYIQKEFLTKQPTKQ